MLLSSIKKYATYAILIIIMFLLAFFSNKQIQKLSAENSRINDNMKNINLKYAVSSAKNGELIYSVNSLTVKEQELSWINQSLANSLDNLNLKMKNLQSLTNIEYRYSILYDTINMPVKLNKLKYEYSKVDSSGSISGYINLPENLFSTDSLIANDPKNYPYLSGTKYEIKDTLLIVPEFKYKRSWIFWKKVTGVEVHVKSSSPNFKMDRLESFQVVK